MQWFMDLMNWFAGDGRYHNLIHCMDHDMLWITITVTLDIAVAAGYLLIAKHWYTNQKALKNARAKRAMGRMKNIFIFCGICGYIFIPIKMVWPAWRLYDLFMAVLVYFTWRYALDTRGLRVVYNELNLSEELAEDLAKSQDEARRKSYFLNAVNHDLRTPLNGLSLQVDLATATLESGDKASAQQALREARESLAATVQLLNGFLEVAHLDWSEDRVRPTLFPVREAVMRAVSRFHGEAAVKGLTLRVSGDERLEILSDRLKLERVVSNLVSNSVKFTHQGSIAVDVKMESSGVLVEVRDTGIGISRAHQAEMFDELFQGHNIARDRNSGLGLGLSISKRLVEQLGGTLTVASEVGQGSRFRISLPGARIVDSKREATEHDIGISGQNPIGPGRSESTTITPRRG